MDRPIPRAVRMALLGALLGPLCLVAALTLRPRLSLEMDRELPPRLVSGLYDSETVGEETFAWTSDRARLSVPGLDRRVPWRCVVRFRGGRPAGIAEPALEMAIDGQPVASRTASNEYQEIEATAPARSTRGLRLALTSSSTFQPGAGDPRQLGVQIDRLSCAPSLGLALPTAGDVAAAAGGAALFGALFGLSSAAVVTAAGGTLAVALLQAFPFSTGLAPYTGYDVRAFWLALWIALPAAGGLWLARRGPAPPRLGAQFAVLFSAVVLFAKLLALLHPAKPLVDALFHAHRLEYVLGGRYFFTQVMPGGVQFPYAIALYVVAAPWAAIAHDHVALLRVVVSASEAAAGLLWYWAIARAWKDPLVAGCALVLFHLVPVSYVVVGNANLTNAFGQSAAVATMAGLVGWSLGSRDWLQIAGLSALAAIGLLSHVTTFALLSAAMVFAAGVYAWRGGRPLLPVVRSIAIALSVAVTVSVGLYYGRPEFFDAYASATRAKVETAERRPAAAPAAEAGEPGERLAEGAIPVTTLPHRTVDALRQVVDAFGWPLLVLACVGLWRVVSDGATGRLAWAVAGWLVATGIFLVFGIVVPGGVGHQRQAMEFVARAAYAGSPAVVVLAACGAAWGWRARGTPRLAVVGAMALAAFVATRMWAAWI